MSDPTALQAVRMTHPQAKYLQFVADHGGEIDFDWSKYRPDAAQMVKEMINKGLVIEREYFTHALQLRGQLKLRLTDLGRAVVGQLEASLSKARVIQAI